jgi:hypothetical protein
MATVWGNRSLPPRWWSRTRGLPIATYQSWLESMRVHPGRQARILAWARTPNGVCIGSPSLLSYGNESAWRHVGWHEIEHGGWNSETDKLSWSSYEGRREFIELAEPGRMPELFRERVSASIVAERFVPIAGERGVTVSGRRDLAGTSAVITWHQTLGRGLSWNSGEVRTVADAALAELQAEYGLL